MTKNFVLDTNVLLHDPSALFKFRDNRIIIPITVERCGSSLLAKRGEEVPYNGGAPILPNHTRLCCSVSTAVIQPTCTATNPL